MKIAIRVDASSVIGTGHVARCLTLAAALRAEGADVRFVCRLHAGHLCDLIEAKGFVVTRMPVRKGGNEGAYATWLGATEDVDAVETAGALRAAGSRCDWVVVDHYGIGAEWESAIAAEADRILVIDDLANRAHHCNLLLDQNLARDASMRYRELVPSQCEVLTGVQYALLGPEYAERHDHGRVRTGKISRITVFFGGGDLHDLSVLALTSLSRPEFGSIAVDVVVGASNPHREDLLALAAARPHTQVLEGLPTLAELWSSADLAVASSGMSTWERICCGLPALIVTTGANQLEPVAVAEEAGCVIDLGDATVVTVDTIASAVAAMVADEARVRAMSERCAGLIDGLGTSRVLRALTR